MIDKLLTRLFLKVSLHGKIEKILDMDEYLNKAKLVELGIFDSNWYLVRYPDIKNAGVNPYVHYMIHGWKENREISPKFEIHTLKAILNIGDVNPIAHLRNMETDLLNRAIDSLNVKKNESSCLVFRKTRLTKGISIIGHFTSEIGLGEASRNIAYALDSASVPSSFIDIKLVNRSNDTAFESKCNNVQDRLTNFVICGIIDANHFFNKLEPGRVNCLYPSWELSRIPKELKKQLSQYDFLFAPSQFIGDALSETFNQKITVLRQPVSTSFQYKEKSKSDSVLRIICYFDFDSHIARKNPKAAIEAFKLAFPPRDDSAMLTIKVRGMGNNIDRQLLEKYVARDPRIKVIDKTLSRFEMNELIASHDVLLSTHRSEGFGFAPAEALAVGKVVVSTDYSGTRDFINELTGYPVHYDLVRVKDNEYPHAEDQFWANPSIDHAASCLREIHSNWETAKSKGIVGLNFMKDHYSPIAVGESFSKILSDYELI